LPGVPERSAVLSGTHRCFQFAQSRSLLVQVLS
jgi:hypothetical protein